MTWWLSKVTVGAVPCVTWGQWDSEGWYSLGWLVAGRGRKTEPDCCVPSPVLPPNRSKGVITEPSHIQTERLHPVQTADCETFGGAAPMQVSEGEQTPAATASANGANFQVFFSQSSFYPKDPALFRSQSTLYDRNCHPLNFRNGLVTSV